MNLNVLIGREFVKKNLVTEGIMGRKIKPTRWLITNAYANHVTAVRKGENGFLERASFSIGDLVTMGLLENNKSYQYWRED